MTYRVLPIEEFGRELIASGDLDPVYIMLNRSGLDDTMKARWCLAYWCLYHTGVAAYISECPGCAEEQKAQGFWHLLLKAAENQRSPIGDRWPRGKERRHWRGENAFRSFGHLYSRYKDDPAAFALAYPAPENPEDSISFSEVSEFVISHVGFGPWMAFKVADMLEQCFGIPVNFSEAEVFMFKEPKEAALLFWRTKTGLPEGARPRDEARVIREVVAYLVDVFSDLQAPNGKRPIGLQEVETVLCKWKSHVRGHYPLYNDLDEISAALRAWSEISSLAKKLLESFPQFIRGRAD